MWLTCCEFEGLGECVRATLSGVWTGTIFSVILRWVENGCLRARSLLRFGAGLALRARLENATGRFSVLRMDDDS